MIQMLRCKPGDGGIGILHTKLHSCFAGVTGRSMSALAKANPDWLPHNWIDISRFAAAEESFAKLREDLQNQFLASLPTKVAQRSAKEKLKALRLDNKMSISKYCSLFKEAIEACKALGLTIDFDTLRDQFEETILEKREKKILLRKEFVSSEVRGIKTISRFVTAVTKSINMLYRLESGSDYDATLPLDSYYSNSRPPGDHDNRRDKQRLQQQQKKKNECGGCGGAYVRRQCT